MAYWNKVSSRFSNNQYVVGYDPINEPYVSNYLTNPLIALVPGKFDREVMQPFYKRTFDIY